MKNMKSILIVDDDNLLSEAIQGLMEVHGHAVTCCCHGLDAVKLSENNSFDVILIDFNMPGMKGDLVCRLLRHSHRKAFIVGLSTESKEQEFIAAGANKFLDKSYLVQNISLIHELIEISS